MVGQGDGAWTGNTCRLHTDRCPGRHSRNSGGDGLKSEKGDSRNKRSCGCWSGSGGGGGALVGAASDCPAGGVGTGTVPAVG